MSASGLILVLHVICWKECFTAGYTTDDHFRDDDTLMVFASKCVYCPETDGHIVCKKKTDSFDETMYSLKAESMLSLKGFCVQDGKCYTLDETNGCNLCGGNTAASLQWIPSGECSEEDGSSNKLWIIAVVLGSVALLAGILTTTLCLKAGHKRAGSKVDVQDSSYNSHWGRNTTQNKPSDE